MPYPEYRSWELFYQLEPFGWHNEEYYASTLYAMLYNVNRGKGKAKQPEEFMRDMAKEVLKQLKEDDDLSQLPLEQRRELLLKQVKKDFGIK